jgi:hypothetical protein
MESGTQPFKAAARTKNASLLFPEDADLEGLAVSFESEVTQFFSSLFGDKGYRESLEKGVQEKIDSGKLLEWAGKQAYLALGFGIAAAAELGIDSGPMEGFDKDGFKEVLGLPEYMYPEVLMAVGFRDKEDQNQPEFRKKVRFPKDTLFDFR